MIERVLSSFHDSRLERVKRYQERIRWQGGDCRFVNDERGLLDPRKLFSQSLLGLGLPGIEIGASILTEKEKLLHEGYLATEVIPKILTLVDIDGVIGLPPWGRVDNKNIAILSQIAQASFLTVVWTGRWYVADEQLESGLIRWAYKLFVGNEIARWPLFDCLSIKKLESLGRVSVRTNKSHGSTERELFSIVQDYGRNNGCPPDLIYWLDSKRRQAALDFLKICPNYADRFVYFDTCHKYF